MLWLKGIGALILCGSGLWGARLLNRRAEAALRQATGFSALLRMMKLRVDCYAQALPEILASCEMPLLSECGYRSDVRPLTLEALLAACAVCDAASVAAMREFASEFGRGYREEQVRACAYTLDRLEARRASLETALPSEKKRNTTLCLSAALGIAILLL